MVYLVQYNDFMTPEEGINSECRVQKFHFQPMNVTAQAVPVPSKGKIRQDEFLSGMITCAGECKRGIQCRFFVGFHDNVDKLYCTTCALQIPSSTGDIVFYQHGEPRSRHTSVPKPTMTLKCYKCPALVLIKVELPLEPTSESNSYRFTLKPHLLCHKHYCSSLLGSVYDEPAHRVHLEEVKSQPLQAHHPLDNCFAGPPIHIATVYCHKPFTLKYIVADESKD